MKITDIIKENADATTTGSGSVATVSTTLGEPITRDSFSNKEQKEKYGNSANMAEYKAPKE